MNQPDDDLIDAELQETMELKAVESFVATCMQNKQLNFQISNINKKSKMNQKELMEKLEAFMSGDGATSTCWTIPRKSGPLLYLRKTSKPSTKGLTLGTLSNAFIMIDAEYMTRCYQLFVQQKQSIPKPSKLQDLKVPVVVSQNILMSELISFALTRALRDAMEKKMVERIVVTETSQKLRITKEDREVMKISKKAKNSKEIKEQHETKRKMRAHPKPVDEIVAIALEYFMEKKRLVKKTMELKKNEKIVRDKLGPLVFWADDVTPEAVSVAEKKKLEIKTMGSMSNVLKSVQNYLARMNPNGKSYKLDIKHSKTGEVKPYLIREKYTARKPAMTLGMIDTIFGTSSMEYCDNIQSNIDLTSELDFNNWNDGEKIKNTMESLTSVFQSHFTDHMDKYTSRTIRYVLDNCSNPKKSDVVGSKRKRQPKLNEETEEDCDENELNETQLKCRKLDQAISAYSKYIEKDGSSTKGILSHVIESTIPFDQIDDGCQMSDSDDDEELSIFNKPTQLPQ